MSTAPVSSIITSFSRDISCRIGATWSALQRPRSTFFANQLLRVEEHNHYTSNDFTLARCAPEICKETHSNCCSSICRGFIDWVKVLPLRPTLHKIGHFGDIPYTNLLTWYGKLNLTQQKQTFINQKKCKTTQHKHDLECGPMPNVMANIGGALCSMPQNLADAHY